ncbi:MAG: phosphopantetheine-binding protein [Burkholderiaceae bacterium]|jgi:acyl carrier protein|nr:phosphopantetheine-binding protein [Burkholderiaceae bacterium]
MTAVYVVPKNKDEIYKMVVGALHDMFELERSKLVPEANLFSDLDIDSIDAVDLAAKFNEMTGKRMTPEAYKKIRTIQDMVDALSDLLLEKSA